VLFAAIHVTKPHGMIPTFQLGRSP